MERRFILAIVLMLLVALLPSLFLKKPAARRTGAPADTNRAGVESAAATTPPVVAPSAGAPVRPSIAVPAETVWVTSPLYRLGFSTSGGRLVHVELLQFRSFAAQDSARNVQLIPPGTGLLGMRLVQGADTADLEDWTFKPNVAPLRVTGPGTKLTLIAERGGAQVTLEYTFSPDEYRFDVAGHVAGLGRTGAVLALDLGQGLRSVEADSTDDFRHYAVVTKAGKTQSTAFQSLKPGEAKLLDGPFEWVGVKSKYFLLAALTLEENEPKFAGSIAVGGARTGKTASRAAVSVTLPVAAAGDMRFQVYAGPLEYRRLAAVGHDLDDANPYGGVLRPFIQPVSIWVVNILLWMHGNLHLAYGWVLVIFGILIRVLLWPLNQRAMESSIRMQAVQPLIKATQDRYKDDPERLQREMMKIYKEHQVNPLGGCLPMLIPMPVLFALFFVFNNTIEFRGVPFLWLPDLSRADPYYIIPVIMGLSMFVLSKVGQMGAPPNPQATMMLYFMPIFMTVLFVRFASGLNLYYAVSNIFSIPQQYRIARRRMAQQRAAKPAPAPS
ncbi:MAG TPA: membrane protein insertase YidC [Gemmatimonadales bacterium]|nr:membrane protein insertase YidC [Gemmatimonadales bacterium]